ncbi:MULTISPECIES: hypothetical protein [unclassified Mesorhizobium]|uniref:hypothetical protein n=1 Tax=unclassified Mesorhizobium TaxID=325217 RepID=UPI0019289B1D|nr:MULTISPECIES: hypothetical protein [unclassified Mesorhizobium]
MLDLYAETPDPTIRTGSRRAWSAGSRADFAAAYFFIIFVQCTIFVRSAKVFATTALAGLGDVWTQHSTINLILMKKF